MDLISESLGDPDADVYDSESAPVPAAELQQLRDAIAARERAAESVLTSVGLNRDSGDCGLYLGTSSSCGGAGRETRSIASVEYFANGRTAPSLDAGSVELPRGLQVRATSQTSVADGLTWHEIEISPDDWMYYSYITSQQADDPVCFWVADHLLGPPATVDPNQVVPSEDIFGSTDGQIRVPGELEALLGDLPFDERGQLVSYGCQKPLLIELARIGPQTEFSAEFQQCDTSINGSREIYDNDGTGDRPIFVQRSGERSFSAHISSEGSIELTYAPGRAHAIVSLLGDIRSDSEFHGPHDFSFPSSFGNRIRWLALSADTVLYIGLPEDQARSGDVVSSILVVVQAELKALALAEFESLWE